MDLIDNFVDGDLELDTMYELLPKIDEPEGVVQMAFKLGNPGITRPLIRYGVTRVLVGFKLRDGYTDIVIRRGSQAPDTSNLPYKSFLNALDTLIDISV
ncbi:MAG: hypothetical protein ABIJ92_00635 [Candidatus Aenigmatarchaeota archaeon]